MTEPLHDDEPALVGIVAERLALVRARIEAAGGDPGAIRIVAVTKTLGPDAVRAALANGLTDIGENYPSELVAKQDALGPTSARWHFLGQIQRRHVGVLAGRVACYQGVDRREEGDAIARKDPGAHVLVEIDTTGIPGRGGVAPGEAEGLCRGLGEIGLVVDGLMTVAPAGGGPPARRAFSEVAALADRLGLAVRSMGMSDDLEEAVASGTTMIRIGQALFGARSPLRSVAE